jgi:integrase
MAKLKLTKLGVTAVQPSDREQELRDTVTPGFLCKVTPAGRKVFTVQYRTNDGTRRKPSIGVFGEITVEEARSIAQRLLLKVRSGGDPGAEKAAAREAPTVTQLCSRFMDEYSRIRNKPRTVESNATYIKKHIQPAIGRLKVPEVDRSDIAAVLSRLNEKPVTANRVLSCLRKMFNMAEVWGHRRDGSNPCRHIPKHPEKGKTRYITDEEVARLFTYLDRAEAQGLEHPTLILASRLQFAFAARMSEILNLRWEWVDLPNRRIVWPDSKTGEISKPMSTVAHQLLSNAHGYLGSPFVCPAIFDSKRPLPEGTYYHGWTRILIRSGVGHVGTHGVRHRSATDIANSGVPIKVGMVLTAHKTVTMFMRYVHVEDDPVRAAAEKVATQRQSVVESRHSQESADIDQRQGDGTVEIGTDGGSVSRVAVGNYRPYRNRKGRNRAAPPGSGTGKDTLEPNCSWR